jgi:hypothetical protein
MTLLHAGLTIDMMNTFGTILPVTLHVFYWVGRTAPAASPEADTCLVWMTAAKIEELESRLPQMEKSLMLKNRDEIRD